VIATVKPPVVAEGAPKVGTRAPATETVMITVAVALWEPEVAVTA
jgi:hypothetical protein